MKIYRTVTESPERMFKIVIKYQTKSKYLSFNLKEKQEELTDDILAMYDKKAAFELQKVVDFKEYEIVGAHQTRVQ